MTNQQYRPVTTHDQQRGILLSEYFFCFIVIFGIFVIRSRVSVMHSHRSSQTSQCPRVPHKVKVGNVVLTFFESSLTMQCCIKKMCKD